MKMMKIIIKHTVLIMHTIRAVCYGFLCLCAVDGRAFEVTKDIFYRSDRLVWHCDND